MKFKVRDGLDSGVEELEFNTLEELTEWIRLFPPDYRMFDTNDPAIVLMYDEDDKEFQITIYNNYLE